MIDITELTEDEDGYMILRVDIDMPDLKRLARVGMLKILEDTLEEFDSTQGDIDND